MIDTKNNSQEEPKHEHHFQMMFDNAPDAYLIMDIDHGCVITCNLAAETMLRGNRDRIIGKTPDQLSPKMQPDGKESMKAVPEKIKKAMEID